MTATDTPNKYRYQGNGSTDTFAFSGRVFATTDLVVEIILRADDSLVETLTINTDYTVTIASNGTASVEVTNALKIPSSLQDILLRRVLPQSQSVSLPTGTVFPAKVVETGLDRGVALVQDLDEAIGRSIKLPPQTSATVALTVEPEDDKILAWDGTTGQLKNGPTTASFETATSTAVAAAATATTQAGLASTAKTNAETAETNAELQVTYAEEWAQNPEDDPVSVAAGGDDSTTYSALHWAAKAFDFAQSVNLPALGAANTVLQVNAGGTANEYEKIKALNVDINAATDTVITASDEIWFADVTDSSLVKKDTVQGILDLVTAGGLVPIKTVTASNVASVDFVNGSGGVVLDGTYNAYVLIITDAVLASTGNTLGMRVSTDSGATWKNTSGDYYYAYNMVQSDSAANSPGVSKTETLLLVAIGAGGGANESVAGIVHIFNPADTTKPMKMSVRTAYENNGGELRSFTGDGKYTANTAVNGIRLLSSSGNVSLTATLYGLASA